MTDLVASYNSSYHRTMKHSPDSVTPIDVSSIRVIICSIHTTEKTVLKYKVDDKVRISKVRTFEKSYLPNWTEEIFNISDAISTYPPTYRLKDCDGELIEGSLYDHELQRIIKMDDVYKIAKVICSRKRKDVKEYLVKCRSYPNKFNSWVKEADTQNVI